jgi:hypothetical protein
MAENVMPPRDNLYRADFAADLELREDTDGGGPPRLVGHFARFNEWTEINSVFEGRFMERIAPGAMAKTIREGRSKMRVLFQHGRDFLGEQILGRIDVLREDDIGAYYEVPLYDGIPPLLLNGLRDGQYGASYRFRAMQEEFVRKPKPAEHNPDGLPERTITEASVREFGPVTFPAYDGATAAVRSVTDEFMLPGLRDLLALAGSDIQARAAALTEPEPPQADTTRRSRSTRAGRDYLRHHEEAKPWQL